MSVDAAKTLFLVVHGGTFPTQDCAVIRPTTGRVDSRLATTNRTNSSVFEQAPDVPPDNTVEVYPFSPRFQVSCDADIGTIDQLVAQYRSQLILSAEYLESGPVSEARRKETQEYLAKCRDKLDCTEAGVASVQWDTDPLTGRRRICLDAAEKRAALPAASDVPDERPV